MQEQIRMRKGNRAGKKGKTRGIAVAGTTGQTKDVNREENRA